MRRRAGNLFIDRRGIVEIVGTIVIVVVFLSSTGLDNFDETLSDDRRSTLYGSLAGSAAALLGFVLAALSILVALPSTERIAALKTHPKWPRVPSSYFRASRALLASLVLCTLGIVLDSAREPWIPYETTTVALLGLTLVRVIATVVALDQILSVVRQDAPREKNPIDDPGP